MQYWGPVTYRPPSFTEAGRAMTDYTPPEPQPWRTEEEARQWAADFGGSGDPYGLPLWYHSPTQQGLVLFEDGVTTPSDLALEIASGPTDYN